MTLHYYFDDISADILVDVDRVEDGMIDTEYDYEVEVSGYALGLYNGEDDDNYNEWIDKWEIIHDEMYESGELAELEDDPDFIEFMCNLYESDARAECEEMYL